MCSRFIKLSTKQARISLTGLLALLLASCTQAPPAPPMCRSDITDKPISVTRAACVIRVDNAMVIIKNNQSGRLQLPAVKLQNADSPACELHRATFDQTGFNVNVSHLLNPDEGTSSTHYFNCELDADFDSSFSNFPTPYWAREQVAGIYLKDPFTLSDYEWRDRDELVYVLSMFNKSTQKGHDNHRTQ